MKIIILLFANIYSDITNLVSLWNLLYSFLLSNKNLKSAKKIHRSQPLLQRITLSYVKTNTLYPNYFRKYYRFYLFYLFWIVPQYILVAIISALSKSIFFSTLLFLLFVKFIFCWIIRSNYSTGISRFDKRYKKRMRRNNDR